MNEGVYTNEKVLGEKTIGRNLIEKKIFRQDTKFKRGQLWLLKGEEAHKEDKNGCRPVVIVSNDTVNRSDCSTVTVVPCTTNTKYANICTSVTYFNYRGDENVIQTQNIFSVNKEKLVCYLSTLDEELMEEIEQAMRIQIGIAEPTGGYYRKEIKSEIKNSVNGIKIDTSLINQANNNKSFVHNSNKVEYTKVNNIEEKVEDKIINLKEKKVSTNAEGVKTISQFLLREKDLISSDEKPWSLTDWRNAKRIKWSRLRELEFMKFYSELGAKGFANSIDMKVSTCTQKASELKKKYPDFLSKSRA